MKLERLWPELDRLLARLGLTPVPFALKAEERAWAPIFTDRSLEDIAVPLAGQPYRFNESPVFIYIRDTNLKHNTPAQAEREPEEYPRIHLTECKTIAQMRAQGRFERYVMTDLHAGPLPLNLKSRDHKNHNVNLNLFVCINCLHATNWQGFAEPGTPRRAKNHIREEFSRAEFLKQFSPSFAGLPLGRYTDPPDEYTDDWPEVSRHVRESSGRKCESCLVRAPGKEIALLDVHHRDHRKRNNAPGNLQVLCKLCHAARHEHYHVSQQDRERLKQLRREQGIPNP